jgi:hypothetical protein
VKFVSPSHFSAPHLSVKALRLSFSLNQKIKIQKSKIALARALPWPPTGFLPDSDREIPCAFPGFYWIGKTKPSAKLHSAQRK